MRYVLTVFLVLAFSQVSFGKEPGIGPNFTIPPAGSCGGVCNDVKKCYTDCSAKVRCLAIDKCPTCEEQCAPRQTNCKKCQANNAAECKKLSGQLGDINAACVKEQKPYRDIIRKCVPTPLPPLKATCKTVKAKLNEIELKCSRQTKPLIDNMNAKGCCIGFGCGSQMKE